MICEKEEVVLWLRIEVSLPREARNCVPARHENRSQHAVVTAVVVVLRHVAYLNSAQKMGVVFVLSVENDLMV